MARATIFDVTAAPTAGGNDHVRTAQPTLEKAAEEVFPALFSVDEATNARFSEPIIL